MSMIDEIESHAALLQQQESVNREAKVLLTIKRAYWKFMLVAAIGIFIPVIGWTITTWVCVFALAVPSTLDPRKTGGEAGVIAGLYLAFMIAVLLIFYSVGWSTGPATTAFGIIAIICTGIIAWNYRAVVRAERLARAAADYVS